ncbi:hypothetical protein PaG_01447 [Moesziomyces aphidis]|uniref:Uncharacterized protein n=1 Tax=Moesziomyces aphidis TaxID=84754 RepID=W3VRD7_MOEAP|nr:hypothetical protein PaG_01447 [Moesziomyces aphidis]
MAPPQSTQTTRSPPRPSSVSLRAPRSASVQQLVSRWETQPEPTATSTASASSAASASSSSPLLRANAVIATNGTLGPLDWTPKYGLPAPLTRVSTKITASDPQDPSADQQQHRSSRPRIPPASPRGRHVMPLRSVHPVPTIPSPSSPCSPPIHTLPEPSPPCASRTPSSPPSTLDSATSKHTSKPPSTIPASDRAKFAPPSSLASQAQSKVVPAPSTTRSSQDAQSRVRDFSPRDTNIDRHDGLGNASHTQGIFDLDAKVPLGTGRFLPSSFRRNLPDQAASIPERSSSHLSAPQPTHEQWSPEEASSIPLLPSAHAADSEAYSSKTRGQAAQWRQLVSEELAQNAVCSNVDAQRLPISADEVFKRDAPPIDLPALEEYLRNPIIFGDPGFTPSDQVCTDQEKLLFGLDGAVLTQSLSSPVKPSYLHSSIGPASPSKKSRFSSKSAHLEVAGGQISCPAVLYSSSVDSDVSGSSKKKSDLRQRRKAAQTKQLPAHDEPQTRKGLADHHKDADDDSDPLLEEVAWQHKGDLGAHQRAGQETLNPFEDIHQVPSPDFDDDATLIAQDSFDAEQVVSRISARLTESQQTGARKDAPSSKFSTSSHPITRKHMFPPLMLLKENNLDELKSNAIGPRKPPGGLWAVGWLGIIFDMVIGVEGSTFAAGILRLETLRDLFQIMTIQLHFQRYFDSSDPTSTSSKVFKFMLQTLPAFLGFDLVSVFGYAVIFFVIWISITALALWRFWHMTKAHNPNKTVEGFDSQGWVYKSASRGTRFANTCLVFVLGLLYLPLSKLAVDALVWSSDFWPVPNPYKGGVDHPDPGPLLGDPDIWRAPLDFCYTTTMRKDAFNWAYVVIPLAVLTILFYTLWYPYKLMMTIREMLPRVSAYNELGRKRSNEEMQIYYQRLLNRDKSPFNFLYNSYHRKWGYYKPLYILLFKLTNLLIIGVLAKDNCLFRNVRTRTMLVAQQVTLIVVMAALLGIHLLIKPFVDKIGNRSEMVSRIGYVLTATIGLLVALNVQGSTVYNTTILYIVQAFTYGGNIYFALIGMSFVAHQVKRWQSRVDYTIDLFSPVLDMTKHIKRRVWQETLSIIILCAPEYHMPLEQVIAFSVSDDERWPPYLIDFRGSVAERHIENLKIVKQIGIDAYRREIDFSRTAEGAHRQKLLRTIQSDYAGPDVHWRPPSPPFPSGVMSFFGKAFVVPFPPTLVMCYDEGTAASVVLTKIDELEAFIAQNSDSRVQSKRRVRQALRALEGQRVLCPHVENVQVGDATSGMVFVDKLFGRISRRRRALPRFGMRTDAHVQTEYVLATPVSYVEGTLKIERRNEFDWAGYNFDGGFEVSIVFDEGRTKDSSGALSVVRRLLQVSASRAFGLTEDFSMNASLSRFLQDNERVVVSRAPLVEKMLRKYRRDFEREARWKERVLPYSFLVDVFDNDGLSPLGLRMALVETGCARSMRNLPVLYEGCVTLMYERLAAINRSPVHRFWWMLFDELWRLNSADYAQLRKHRTSFSPQYPLSIAYRPLPRAELERFLAQRGLWHKNGAKGGPFNRGMLNRIYFYLNEIVFAGHHDGRVLNPRRGWSHPDAGSPNPFLDPVSSDLRRVATIKVGLGHDATHATRRGISTVDDTFDSSGDSGGHAAGDRSWGMTANASVPSQYTGGGTAYSTASVVVRTAYRWEQRLDGVATHTRWQRTRLRALQWLSLHPVELKLQREKLFLYLKLVDTPTGQRYELLRPSCRRTDDDRT